MPALRIFCYQPSPRVWKATIAARLNGVQVEVRGAAPHELADWLWDFDAHPLSDAERADPTHQQVGRVGFIGLPLYKTAAFLDAHPFGTVPAAFSGDGSTGIFESNSILRAVGRLGAAQLPLYGEDVYSASRIDSFLDASLVFGRDTQPYLLALRAGLPTPATHATAAAACTTYLAGMERALAPAREFLVGACLSLADICYACELTMLWSEKAHSALLKAHELAPTLPIDMAAIYPRAARHFARLREHPAFAPDLAPYLAKLEARATAGGPPAGTG